MRWNLLLGLGLGFLTSLALLPEGEMPESARKAIATAHERGFNEGFESGTCDVLRTVELRKLGEFYFDAINQRSAFRWYCDDDPAVESPENAPASSLDLEEPPRRVTQLSLDPKSRVQSVRRPPG